MLDLKNIFVPIWCVVFGIEVNLTGCTFLGEIVVINQVLRFFKVCKCMYRLLSLHLPVTTIFFYFAICEKSLDI